MFTTLGDLTSQVAADLLVVGSGPAGLALALAARERGARVVVLESGGAHSSVDELNRVGVTGLPYAGAYTGRARGFGGTGEQWAGQCLPLDDIDLRVRDWVPGSGWPLDPGDLRTWGERAAELFEVADATFGPVDLAGAPVPLPPVDGQVLSWRIPHYSPGHRLGSRMRARCAADPDLTVVLDATAVELVTKGPLVTGVVARSRSGHQESVPASVTVLACGAIENARLLMETGSVLGDLSPFLGHGLQDHPSWLVGEVVGAPPELGQVSQSMTVGGRRMRAKLVLSPVQQAAGETLNCVADLELDHGRRSSVGALKRGYDAVSARRDYRAFVRELPRMAAGPGAILREFAARRRGVGPPPDRHTRLLLRVQTEQPPLGPSSVSLSSRTDALGRRAVDVAWEIGESEQRTCTVMAEAVAGQIASLGLGRLEIAPWLADATAFRSRAIDSYHHAGTTRMSADPALGVVDPDGRVHGADGLYVTGGSLFPTSGHAHPTLTIVALALRLADHLASRP